MTDNITIPDLQNPGSVDPRTGAVSGPFFDFLRALAQAIGDPATTESVEALIARVEALEAAGTDVVSLFGTGGIQIYGDANTGFQIDGSALQAQSAGGMGPPGRDGEDGQDAWPIPGLTGPMGPPGLFVPGMDGEPGEDGMRGPPGADGAAGAAGAAGATGAAGPPGMDGADGDCGEPWPMIPPTNLPGLSIQSVAGRASPYMTGPSGIGRCLDIPEITSWHGWYRGGANAAGTYMGYQGANAGTAAAVAPTTTNRATMLSRSTFSSVVTTQNQQVGSRQSANFLFRGNAAGIGGFWCVFRFMFASIKTGERAFVGVTANSAIVSVEPSTQVNCAGFAFDAADSAWTFMHNDASGTCTKDAIAGQATLASNNTGFIAVIGCYPNDSKIYYALYDLVQAAWLCDTFASTDLPVNTTGMGPACVMSNGTANTAANDAVIGISTIDVYTES